MNSPDTNGINEEEADENKVEDPSKRAFLKKGLAAVGFTLMGIGTIQGALGIKKLYDQQQQTENDQLDSPDSANSADEQPKSVEDEHGFSRCNKILKTPLFPDTENRREYEKSDRYQKEKGYVEWAKTLEQIDNGLSVVVDCDLRAQLINKRYALRKEGLYGLRKLTQAEQTWCLTHNVHPEGLAMCTDAYFEARKILVNLWEKMGGKNFLSQYRPDLPENIRQALAQSSDNIDDLLINPGGLLGIALNETVMMVNGINGIGKVQCPFINIGTQPAIEMIKQNYPKEADKRISDLRKLCTILKQEGQLEYITENMSASKTADIFLQYSIDTAIELANTQDVDFNFKFTPAHPQKALVGAILHLFRGQVRKNENGQMEIERYGYKKGDQWKKFREGSLAKWNPTLVNSNLFWAEDYSDEIISSKDKIFDQIKDSYLNKPN